MAELEPTPTNLILIPENHRPSQVRTEQSGTYDCDAALYDMHPVSKCVCRCQVNDNQSL